MTRADLNEWVEHPVTKEVLSKIQGEIDNITASILAGEVLESSVDKTAMNVARLSGTTQGLTAILEIVGDLDA